MIKTCSCGKKWAWVSMWNKFCYYFFELSNYILYWSLCQEHSQRYFKWILPYETDALDLDVDREDRGISESYHSGCARSTSEMNVNSSGSGVIRENFQTKNTVVLRYFPPTVGTKRLWNDKNEQFKKKEKHRHPIEPGGHLFYTKYKIRQKLVIAKLCFTSPEHLKVFSNFESAFFCEGHKTTFRLSGGTFCYNNIFSGKKKFFREFFSDLEWTVFGFSKKIFRRGCYNCILNVHLNVLEKGNFEKKWIIFFWLRVKDFRTLGKDLSAGLLKPQCTCPEKHFVLKYVFFRKAIYL